MIMLALLVAWIGFDLLARPLLGVMPWRDSLVDFRLLHDFSRTVVVRHQYPPEYPYPPSAVVLHSVVTCLPFDVAAIVWLALTGTAAVGCWLLLADVLKLRWDRGEYALLPLAHLPCAYFFQWDLRSANCNLLFLVGLLLGVRALLRERDRSAGFWLAFAFSLKLFSVLVLAYLAFKGRWRALGWSLVFIAGFWLLLPALVFGVCGTAEVYTGWCGRVAWAMQGHDAGYHPILTSLAKSAQALGGDSVSAGLIHNSMRGLWLTLLAFGAWLSWQRGRDDFGTLADVALLTLAPIAVSPYLEPYHAVPVAIVALLLLRDGRPAALAVFVMSMAVLQLPLGWEARGLLINVQLLLAVGGAVVVTWQRVIVPGAPRLRVPGRDPVAVPTLA